MPNADHTPIPDHVFQDAADAILATEQPRRVPTMAERFDPAAGRCHTPEQHRHTDGQDADDRSKDRAIRELEAERDGLRDDIQRVEQTRQEQVTELRGRLAAMTEAATDHRKTAGRALSDRDRYARTAANLLAQRNEAAAQAEVATDDALRLAAELDTAQQVATFRQGVIDLHAAELGAAGEVIAVVRDAQEQIERALARYDTAPEVTPVEPEHVHDDIECGCELTPADAPLGSVSPHAQDAQPVLWQYGMTDGDEPDGMVTFEGTPRILAARMIRRPLVPAGPWEPAALIADQGCDDCSVEPGERHRYTGCAGNQRAIAQDDPEGAEQVLRDRIEHAIRARTGEKFPGCLDDFLDRVAAVAAVAATAELAKP